MTEQKKKKKRKLSSRFLWLLLLLSAIVFFITFVRTKYFPGIWNLYLAAGLLIIVIVTGIFTMRLSARNMFQKFVNVVLTVALLISSIILPYITGRISNLIDSAFNNKVKINLYVMNDSYRSEYSYLFEDTPTFPDSIDDVNLEDYAHETFGTMINADKENQSYALNELNGLIGNEYTTVNGDSLEETVNNLYQNTTSIMVMSQSYAAMITDLAGYETFANDTKIIYTFERTIETDTIQTNNQLTDEPFTIFIGGNDETGGLSFEGRTDVDIAITVNPTTHQIVMINMPRDSYIPNPYYGGAEDKLTHLGVNGLDNTVKGLGDYLDVEIQNYLLVNFDTFSAIVDAIGGITINNPYEFTAIDGQHFPEGEIGLYSVSALMYVRERQNLPDGDFGRNMHQQIVLEAIIKKITSPEGIIHFNDILSSLDGYFLTNLSSDAISGLVRKQLSENISWNIVKYHVTGEMGMEICASSPGMYLSVVYPYPNQVEFIQNVIDEVIAGNIVAQEELPEGTFETEVYYETYDTYEGEGY